MIAAVPSRASSLDALCGAASLDALPDGARVGTASVRRTAQLRALRADLDVVPLRGNIDTRLSHLRGGEYDAIVLALAGLERLSRADEATGLLTELVPCAGQGALLLAARAGDARDARRRAGDRRRRLSRLPAGRARAGPRARTPTARRRSGRGPSWTPAR